MKSIRQWLTADSGTSFAPHVVLPRWKSATVDILTLISCGLIRWRWGGITLNEWYSGFATIERTEGKE